MKAMILAAGMGTRLRPLTDNRPKALVKIGGYTMLELAIRYLMKYGIKEIIINIHHFADQIEEYIDSMDFGAVVHFSDEREQLLDTGGGIRHASWFLNTNSPFVVMAVDVLTDLNLYQMVKFHQEQKALVTLAVKERITSRSLLFNSGMRLSGWKNNKTGELKGIHGEEGYVGLGFSGIHVMDPKIFDLMNETGAFSIIDFYLSIMNAEIVEGFRHDNTEWLEFGRAEKLEETARSNTFNKLIAGL